LKTKLQALSAFFAFLFGVAYLMAGEPLIISSTGAPYKWDNSAPLPFHPDGGGLGLLSNVEAVTMTAESFQIWASVPMTTIAFFNGGQITDTLGNAIDVTLANLNQIDEMNGLNEIVFDETGEIFDAFFGPGSGVLGFAGPDFLTNSAPFFVIEASAFLNGRFVDGNQNNGEISVPVMKAVFVHEFGHYLNLAHSQVNGFAAFFTQDDVQGFGAPPDSTVETMYPVLGDVGQASPHADDIAAFALLYGDANFSASTGAITGRVFFKDSVTPANGANVIARNTSGAATIFEDAVSQISGAFSASQFSGGSSDPNFIGRYTLNGLTPGANYSVEIDEIGVGGFSSATLIPFPGPEDFYNGANESADPDIDDEREITTLTPTAGATVSNIDIIFNDELPPLVLDKYDDSIETVLSTPNPAGANDHFAVRHSLPASIDAPYTISAIRFFNNDDQTVWPRLMVVAPNGSGQPDLANPLAVFNNVAGGALQFINLNANLEVNSLDDFFVVIQLPPGQSLNNVGSGGGPGIGADTNLRLGFIAGNLVSTDGVNFVQLEEANLAIEIVLAGVQRPDAFEPNDNIANAKPVILGSRVKGYIDPPGDLDFYSFTGSAGDFVRVDVSAQVLGSGIDGFLTLLNSAGQVIAENDDESFGIRIDPLLETTLPTNDTYFLIMDTFENHANNAPVGGPAHFYEFTINKLATSPRLTHATGNVSFTMWANGVYGDDGTNTGDGFSFMGSPGATLFSGGFLAATSTKIAVNVPSVRDDLDAPLVDFEQQVPFAPFSSSVNFNQIAFCEFDEGAANAFNSPIGVTVRQTSLSNSNDKFVLVQCEITNTTTATISNIYFGQFADWDVGVNNFLNNRGGYDGSRNLIYMFEFGSNLNDVNFYGIKTLQSASGARLIVNDQNLVFTAATVFDALSNFNGPGPQPVTTNADYWSFIGSGPFTLAAGASVTIGFAWVGGASLTDLQANADAAQAAWNNFVVSVEDEPVAPVPAQFLLEQNYPNPFNPSTKIKYGIAENTQVSLIIYNMLGQAVRTLVNERQSPNFYEIEWDGRNDEGILLSSGVYFYKLTAGAEVQLRKMLFLK
jgi:hypothetical protein